MPFCHDLNAMELQSRSIVAPLPLGGGGCCHPLRPPATTRHPLPPPAEFPTQPTPPPPAHPLQPPRARWRIRRALPGPPSHHSPRRRQGRKLPPPRPPGTPSGLRVRSVHLCRPNGHLRFFLPRFVSTDRCPALPGSAPAGTPTAWPPRILSTASGATGLSLFMAGRQCGR